jgi:hypothetical protein
MFAVAFGGRNSTDKDSAGIADVTPRPFDGKACGISIFGKSGRRGLRIRLRNTCRKASLD